MRIIDADAFKEGWIDSTLGNTMRMVIDGQPTIDPESLPVVQQLRANLERSDQEMQNLLKSMESLYKQRDELRAELEKVKAERDAAIQELDGVDLSVGELADFIDAEIYPIVPYDTYNALRENADSISIWTHETEWRGAKEG